MGSPYNHGVTAPSPMKDAFEVFKYGAGVQWGKDGLHFSPSKSTTLYLSIHRQRTKCSAPRDNSEGKGAVTEHNDYCLVTE